MDYKILAINPGSTSTKVAVYENFRRVFEKSFTYSPEDLRGFKNSYPDQFEMRLKDTYEMLKDFDLRELSAVSGRGGLLPPCRPGAQLVNDAMIEQLRERPVTDHASNLGAPLVFAIAQPLGIPAYIYDPVVVDEIEDIARLSGLPDVPRICATHVLNKRATAIKVAKKDGKNFPDVTYIVTHMGGGQTSGLFKGGREIDIVEDDGGSYAPERSGVVSPIGLIKLCYKNDINTMMKKIRGKGGYVAYLGTSDIREVERRIDAGDKWAKLVFEGHAYQTAKDIGRLATVVYGKVDKIILTGGAAYSKRLTDLIISRVSWIAPVQVEPGENELEALALGVLRVLKGEEQAHIYH